MEKLRIKYSGKWKNPTNILELKKKSKNHICKINLFQFLFLRFSSQFVKRS